MKRWHWVALILMAILSLVGEYMVTHTHSHAETPGHDAVQAHVQHWWSGVPAFYILFGFIGCVLLIVVAKILGKLFLLKKEDYYDAL